eukprot:CAMPEP_0116157340 /NCGR_PEP_ID=MMETSP0329-20121206/23293_1 /TAXON_ID=697910 /ORGANISM="Pseudo-nitzschia arenysensis, Strain B593" /LENGTH=81 /DNA_ID=CAMNT_0003654443 /DNA_START=242 /DNA_END=487 /DNA_ORIENTATION=+
MAESDLVDSKSNTPVAASGTMQSTKTCGMFLYNAWHHRPCQTNSNKRELYHPKQIHIHQESGLRQYLQDRCQMKPDGESSV